MSEGQCGEEVIAKHFGCNLVHFRKEKERKGSNRVISKMSHTERYQSSQAEFRAFCNVCREPHLTGLYAERSSWLLIDLVWTWDFSPVRLLLGEGSLFGVGFGV